MADFSRKTASIYINHQAAEDALKALQLQADKLQQKIKAGEAAGKNMVKEIQKLNTVTTDIKKVQDQIDKGLRPSMNQLESTVKRLRNELKRMSEDAPGYAEKFKAFNAASTELQRMKTSIDGVQKSGGLLKEIFASAIPLTGIAAVSAFLKGAVTEALDAEKAAARLENTLGNLGRTDAFDRLMDKADEMAARFKFIDNDDVVGVFEQLITYGKLTEQQINNLTPVIVDFAAKARISLAESASLIIKALEGNGKALKEYGINIKDAGTETERLNVIMTTLKTKVDGAAEAFGETTQGKIATTEQQFKNLKEEIGTGLLPILNKLLVLVNAVVKGLNYGAQGLKIFFGQEAQKFGSIAAAGLANYKKELDFTAGKSADGFAQSLKSRNLSAAELNGLLQKQSGIVQQLEKDYQALLDGTLPAAQNEQAAKNILAQIAFAKAKINAISGVIDEATNRTLGIDAGEGGGKSTAAKTKNVKKAVAQQVVEVKREIARAIKATLEDGPDAPDLIGNAAQSGFANATRKRLQDLAADLENATGKDRLKVKLKMLDAQRLAELNNTELTEKQKQDIVKKFQAEAQQAQLDFYTQQFESILNIASQASDLILAINRGKDAKDENKINDITLRADAEANANKNLLNRKLIDQETYDKRQKQLEDKKQKDLEVLKRRQFERDKRAELVQAGISAAQSVLTTLKQFGVPFPPNFLGIGAMLLTVATNTANINAIASKQYARGGVFDGPRHSEGGMPVYSRGRKVAELEGGEPILSRNTYRNNRHLVDALLYTSMYQGGQSISSSLFNRPHMGLNYAAVNKTLTVSRRNYERGGVFTADGAGGVAGTDVLGAVLQQLALQLQQPLKAYVAYSDVNAAKELDDFVKSNTTLTR